MDTVKNKVKTVDEYIALFPEETSKKLIEIRQIIKTLVLQAEEKISYNIPGYFLNGMLVYFAGFKNHIALYPFIVTNTELDKEIEEYKSGKATIQFKLNEPLPTKLITKLVKFRVSESLKKQK